MPTRLHPTCQQSAVPHLTLVGANGLKLHEETRRETRSQATTAPPSTTRTYVKGAFVEGASSSTPTALFAAQGSHKFMQRASSRAGQLSRNEAPLVQGHSVWSADETNDSLATRHFRMGRTPLATGHSIRSSDLNERYSCSGRFRHELTGSQRDTPLEGQTNTNHDLATRRFWHVHNSTRNEHSIRSCRHF